MIHRKIAVHAATGASMDTYILSPSEQIQVGRKKPAVIVCPGGAYLRISDQEAEQVALHFNALGYHAAVLSYSCGESARMPNPLIELASAVRAFRERAKEWGVDGRRIAVCGFSAGGHLCALLSADFRKAARLLNARDEDVRPDAAILGYPCIDMSRQLPPVPLDGFTVGAVDPARPEDSVIPLYRSALCRVDGEPRLDFMRAMHAALLGTPEPSRELRDELSPHLRVGSDAPPAFVWTTFNDNLVPAVHSMLYARALWEKGVPCEFHMFADGVHGLSLADESVADTASMLNPEVAAWFGLCAAWLKKQWPAKLAP